jgi:hypothetical protein
MSASPQHPVSVKVSYWIPEHKDGGEPTETRTFDASNVEPARIGLPEEMEPVKVRNCKPCVLYRTDERALQEIVD